jgi:16S rRNA (adenine1518-N6/adenine1519-N6)-dimethyltransferase
MATKIRAKKSLGQHFLIDRNIAAKIVNELGTEVYGPVIEIGPGMGALTQFLVKRDTIDLYLVEIDHQSVEYLKQHFPELEKKIIQEDFLQFDLRKRFSIPVMIIGNFPYNISSQIFFKILENREYVDRVVCMIQKEVADRIRSGPGTKVYGIMSVLLQAFFHVEILFPVSEKVFVPPPRVKSSVVRLKRNSTKKLACDEKLFFTVVKTSFNQRRKTLRNALKTILLNLDLNHQLMSRRPEQLSVDEFVELTRVIELRLKYRTQ